MARRVVKNDIKKLYIYIYYDEIGMHAQNIDTIY